MYFFFDYIWYRIARVYYKWDSDGFTASAFIGLSLGIFIHDAIQAALKFTNFIDPIYNQLSPYYGKFGVGLILIIVGLNYLRYRKMYWRCRDHWMNEPKGLPYFIKGCAVITFLLLPWILFFFTY